MIQVPLKGGFNVCTGLPPARLPLLAQIQSFPRTFDVVKMPCVPLHKRPTERDQIAFWWSLICTGAL